MTDKKTIKIPTEIKLKTEFFDGYGMAELIKTIITAIVSEIIAYLIHLITGNSLIAMFFVIGSITMSVVFLVKGQNNFSMLDSVINIIKFVLVQKEYRYERGDFNKS